MKRLIRLDSKIRNSFKMKMSMALLGIILRKEYFYGKCME